MRLCGKWTAWALVFALLAMAAGCAGNGSVKKDSPVASPSSEGEQAAGTAKTEADGSPSGITRYFKNRWLDLMDTFEIGLSYGKWVRVEGQYLIGTWGLGTTDRCRRWRLGQRAWVADEDCDTIAPFPLIQIFLYPVLYWEKMEEPSAEEWRPVANTLWGWSGEVETPLWPDPAWSNTPDPLERSTISMYSFDPPSQTIQLGLEGHLGIGGRMRVWPIQALDFAAGVFGWDMLEDDAP